ncbi:MAG: hypothetical protein P1S60_12720, partial [Anaerolineae bacterium]|nr:hypothetical protein [Anaerolineae bacterium]
TPHLFLYQAVKRAIPDAYIDMAFFPPQHDRETFLTHRIPLMTGTQSWQDPAQFDLILVSNAYTLELINLPYLLIHSALPVKASDREAGYPLIILGGSNALATQCIINNGGDSLVDAIFFGEGEGEVETLIRLLFEGKNLSKQARLQKASQDISGLWVANSPLHQHVQKAICTNPNRTDLLTEYPLLNGEEAGIARMQITYGCPAFCSFCFEGYDRKPYRELTLADVWSTSMTIKKEKGSAIIDLVSFNFNTYANILPLILALSRVYHRVSFKSQRVDILAAMPVLLEAELLADKRSYTVGIEGISQRMRSFLHKSLGNQEINNLIKRLINRSVREIKLFYILTGHETQSDVDEFRYFLREMKYQRTAKSQGVRIVFSFGFLIRMPFTPLRYDRLFLEESDWRDIAGLVKSACETNGFEFRLATSWQDYATSQVLAAGGHWLFDPLLALAQKDYFYDSELDRTYWSELKDWLRENGYWDSRLLAEKDAKAEFPLEFLEQSISRDFLYQKFIKAQTGVDDGYCLGEMGQLILGTQDAHCLGCGACTDADERHAMANHVMTPPDNHYLQELSSIMHRKRHLSPIYIHLWLPPETRGKTPAWMNAYVMRWMLQSAPNQVKNVLSVQESLFKTRDNLTRYAGLYGETVFTIHAWDSVALKSEVEQMAAELGGIRFVRWVETHNPGSFARAKMSISLPIQLFPNAGQQLRRFLQDYYIPANIRRTDVGYVLDLPKKALQKRVVFSGDFSEGDQYFDASLNVSSKFDLLAFLQSFNQSYWDQAAQVEITELEL